MYTDNKVGSFSNSWPLSLVVVCSRLAEQLTRKMARFWRKSGKHFSYIHSLEPSPFRYSLDRFDIVS